MKKTFKFKRWMAFLLALVLIATTCISSSDAFLWATGEDTVETTAPTQGPAEATEYVDVGGSGGDPAPAEQSAPEVPAEPVVETPTEQPTEPVPEQPADPVPTEPVVETVTEPAATDESVIPDEPAVPVEGDGTEITDDKTPAEDETTKKPEETPDTEQKPEAEDTYGYSVYFYYGENEGKVIQDQIA